MNALPSLTRTNLLTALSGAPTALTLLLRGYADSDPIWSARPTPNASPCTRCWSI